MKMTSRMNKYSVGKIKKRAIDLWSMNMLTKKHAQLILRCDFTDTDYVKFLLALTERYVRVRGYYKKYPNEESLTNHEIDLAIETFNKERSNC